MDAKTCNLKDEDTDRRFQALEILSLSTDSRDLLSIPYARGAHVKDQIPQLFKDLVSRYDPAFWATQSR